MSKTKPKTPQELEAFIKELPRIQDDPAYSAAEQVRKEASTLLAQADFHVQRVLAEMNMPRKERDPSEAPLDAARRLMANEAPKAFEDHPLRAQLQKAYDQRSRATRAFELAGLALMKAQNDFQIHLAKLLAPLIQDSGAVVRELLAKIEAANKAQSALMSQVYERCGVHPIGSAHRVTLFNPAWIEVGVRNLDETHAELDQLQDKKGVIARIVDAVTGRGSEAAVQATAAVAAATAAKRQAEAHAEDSTDWTPSA